MILSVEKSSPFQADVTGQFEWYFEKAGEEIAWRFFKSVDLTWGVFVIFAIRCFTACILIELSRRLTKS